MKIEQLDIRYSDFASEMTKLCKDKHFDFLVFSMEKQDDFC